MLQITVPAVEQFDEVSQSFISTREQKLSLEHSLVSLAKWEAKWNKPFLSKDNKTPEESADYVRCMTVTQNVDPEVYDHLTSENMKAVTDYIESSMTATWFTERGPKKPSRDVVTSELIYYWMIALNIPFECQKWHLNRLFTLIRVCDIKNTPPKKMSKKAVMNRNRELNRQRREASGSSG